MWASSWVINRFGLDASLEPMEVAKKSIELVKEFLYQTLGLMTVILKSWQRKRLRLAVYFMHSSH